MNLSVAGVDVNGGGAAVQNLDWLVDNIREQHTCHWND